jgi:hypothetical protein
LKRCGNGLTSVTDINTITDAKEYAEITVSHYTINKMKKKYHLVTTVPVFKRKIVEAQDKSILQAHTCMTAHSPG